MEFSEIIAKEIIQKHNLSVSTINVWKTRGKIPDRYGNPDFQKPVRLRKEDIIKQKRLFQILDSKKLKILALCRMADVSIHSVKDAKRGKGNLNRQELKRLIYELQKLRLETKKVVEPLQDKDEFLIREKELLMSFLSNPILVHARIYSPWDNKKIYDILRGQTQLDDGYMKYLISQLPVFILETSI